MNDAFQTSTKAQKIDYRITGGKKCSAYQEIKLTLSKAI